MSAGVKLVNGTNVLNYGGYRFYEGRAAGERDLTMCAQVVNRINGKNVLFTIAGSCLSRGATPGSAPSGTSRTALLGHGYRVMATSTVLDDLVVRFGEPEAVGDSRSVALLGRTGSW